MKAVEYFIKEKFIENGFLINLKYIHFGLTSQDINNTAVPLMIKNSISEILLPQLGRLVSHMNELANSNNVTMIARTHGQPASPTTFGKEIKVFSTRVQNQIDSLLKIPNNGKFGGASGNLNSALHIPPRHQMG